MRSLPNEPLPNEPGETVLSGTIFVSRAILHSRSHRWMGTAILRMGTAILTLATVLAIPKCHSIAQAQTETRPLVESPVGKAPVADSLRVYPAKVILRGADAQVGLLVDWRDSASSFPRPQDVTTAASYQSSDEALFTVDENGVIFGRADGSGVITVTYRGQKTQTHVTVTAAQAERKLDFERDIVPILSKHRCNSSGCHGKAEGQNGFKLSVFGFSPESDHEAITRQGRGRRINLSSPVASLILTKASGGLPHGGGVRIPAESREYQRIRRWIQAGASFGETDAPRIERISVQPSDRQMEMLWTQQLRVVAHHTNGSTEDVTDMATYQVNHAGLAEVDGTGRVTVGEHPGQVAVTAAYLGNVATFQALIPQRMANLDRANLDRANLDRANLASEPYAVRNAIDHTVNLQLRKLRIEPSARATDAEYFRRVSLDVAGRVPSAVAVAGFLADTRPDKRKAIVNELLTSPAYADIWTLRWADILRVDRRTLGHKDAHAYYTWLREQFADNRPFDEFARELLTARGPLHRQPAGYFYQSVKKPGDRASTLSQVFLGVRIACAECHHHPFDRWSQSDYFGMTGYFQSVTTKNTSRGVVLSTGKVAPLKHPRTKASIFPHPLGSGTNAGLPNQETTDVRLELADWLTDPENPFFARATANRIWARMMGIGLVEPVDDFRASNPPSNPQLLDLLAKYLVAADYNVHELIRFIADSEAYQRSSKPNGSNATDERNYSRALLKRMDAEVLYDLVNDVTGSSDKFQGVPMGARAVELWDSEVEHEFLSLFGRPKRKTSCECERVGQPTVGQVLHLLNSQNLELKLRHPQGRVVQMARQYGDDLELITQMYLTFFARSPTAEEIESSTQYMSQISDRTEAAVDLSWAMLNSLEFIFNH
jgi:hypothetical protein